MTTTKTIQYVTLDDAYELNKIMNRNKMDLFGDNLCEMLKALYELTNPGNIVSVKSMGTDFCYEVKMELEEEWN